MLRKLKILLSFDHELSLGGAPCYSTNLFDPTERILSLAEELGLSITLFTDVLGAIRFKEWDEKGFFKHYEDQLGRAVGNKHDVQLHLHPHWLDSEFRDGTFSPSKSFALSSFKDQPWPNNIPGIITQGVGFLTELCRKYDSSYRCIAYRAGGYNLAPETSTILSSLYEQGIRIESSITKGFYFRSKLSKIDFRNMPTRCNWLIAKNGPLNEEASTGLFEIPIASRPRGTFNNLPFLIKRVVYRNRRHQSGGWGIHEGNTGRLDKLKRLFPKSAWQLGFDHGYARSLNDLVKIIKYYVKAHENETEIICAAKSHPKSMGRSELRLMRAFINEARNIFGETLEFCTYRQIYDLKRLERSIS